MADYLEGRHAVSEAFAAGVPLASIMIAAGLKPDKAIDAIRRKAAGAGVPVREVKRSELDELSAHGAHQGIMAVAKPYRYASLEDLIKAAAGQKDALIIACDHVTDTGNLGAIARSAEVVGATGLLIPNKRAAAVTAVTYKASAGAISHLPIAREANLATCLERLKKEGFWVMGASEKASQDIWHAPLEGRIVLVMGSEGEGLSRLVQETCDLLVALPQAGCIGSLNVAQATTAIAYEWMRRCRTQG
ncbi:MAG: 23S rRNA (guanosine(2251)-2'-O)-methyltransferase RlmB [Coriobacteriales bacterium]|nr:23S rRNA (guanosine(2251)-2'-O)-methyltransferase RlmB [Coriobacteriales bacterium]